MPVNFLNATERELKGFSLVIPDLPPRTLDTFTRWADGWVPITDAERKSWELVNGTADLVRRQL